MKLLVKQLTKEILKSKIYVGLMLLLTTFTSFMYFFVHYSIDGNMLRLDSLPALNENQLLYRNGLVSNTILSFNILAVSTALTGFVFAMFYFRFLKTGGKQLGCLKALGFKDATLCGFFIGFTSCLSLVGGLSGFCAGYFASDILIEAGRESYLVTGLIKGLNGISIIIGLFVPAVVFCIVTIFMYYVICRKETGYLIAGRRIQTSYQASLRLANKIAGIFPAKNRLPIRLALRKPIAVLLIVFSVMSFSVMFILGYSLTLSSSEVFESQTKGHHYLYDTHFDTPQQLPVDTDTDIDIDTDIDKTLTYLDSTGTIDNIQRTIAGIEDNPRLLELLDKKGNAIALPGQGEVVIGSELEELYSLHLGDQVTITVNNNKRQLVISGIALNAKSNWVYISKKELSELLSLPEHSYTGILSREKGFEGGTVITYEQKLDALRRGSVSNRSSAIINQAIGCLIGSVLLYLALLLNAQDNTRDVLILQQMGYQIKSIKKMLIDIYRPILWVSFFLTLWPTIGIVKTILKSLSIQIGDYMPFQTNIFVITGIFVLLNVVYFLVQTTFHINIRKVIHRESITDYITGD